MYIDTGTQQYINIHSLQIRIHAFADFLNQFAVKALCQMGSDRPCNAVMINRLFIACNGIIGFESLCDPDSGRPVRHDQ